MVHASESLDSRDLAVQAASSPANAEVLAALWDLFMTMTRVRATGLGTAPGTSVVIRLAKLGPMRVCDLAAELHLDQSTVSRHLAQLCEQGLVERTPDPTDRRAHVMRATDAGTAMARESITARVAMLEGLIADWSDTDRHDFARLITAFIQKLEQHIPEGVRQ